MKFGLFVEGYTEKSLPSFLKRWLDRELPQPVGLKVVRFNGWADLLRDAPEKATGRDGPHGEDCAHMLKGCIPRLRGGGMLPSVHLVAGPLVGVTGARGDAHKIS